MPVPKDKQELFGKVVGRMINEGKSQEEAKNIADRAVRKSVREDRRKSRKG